MGGQVKLENPEKGHKAYTRMRAGHMEQIKQKGPLKAGEVVKEREKPVEEVSDDKLSPLLKTYFGIQSKVKDLKSELEKHETQLGETMDQIRPFVAEMENLTKEENKFKAEFTAENIKYRYLQWTRESKQYKELYTKAFNLLNEQMQQELLKAEEAMKKITAQEKLEIAKSDPKEQLLSSLKKIVDYKKKGLELLKKFGKSMEKSIEKEDVIKLLKSSDKVVEWIVDNILLKAFQNKGNLHQEKVNVKGQRGSYQAMRWKGEGQKPSNQSNQDPMNQEGKGQVGNQVDVGEKVTIHGVEADVVAVGNDGVTAKDSHGQTYKIPHDQVTPSKTKDDMRHEEVGGSLSEIKDSIAKLHEAVAALAKDKGDLGNKNWAKFAKKNKEKKEKEKKEKEKEPKEGRNPTKEEMKEAKDKKYKSMKDVGLKDQQKQTENKNKKPDQKDQSSG